MMFLYLLITVTLCATSVHSASTIMLNMTELNICLNSSVETVMAQFDVEGLIYIYSTNTSVDVLDIPGYPLADCIDEQDANPHVTFLELPAIDIELVGNPVPLANANGVWEIATTTYCNEYASGGDSESFANSTETDTIARRACSNSYNFLDLYASSLSKCAYSTTAWGGSLYPTGKCRTFASSPAWKSVRARNYATCQSITITAWPHHNCAKGGSIRRRLRNGQETCINRNTFSASASY